MNDDETEYLITAMRETREECNIDISLSKRIEPVGLFPYLKNKNLYLFLVEIESLPEIKCNSFYKSNGELVPEMIDYKWIEIGEYSKYVSKGLEIVFNLIKEQITYFIKRRNNET
jgi:8-oxo-dGTP pyrophosphatase MutT (NUDIX family)